MEPALQTYADELALHINSGIAREQTYRPALAALMQTLRDGAVASNDPAHIEAGAPDYTVWIESNSGPLTIGYVEAKDTGISLDTTEDSEQLARYRKLPNLVLTDYLEFRWYRDGVRQDITGRLGHRDGRNLVTDEEGAARVASAGPGSLDTSVDTSVDNVILTAALIERPSSVEGWPAAADDRWRCARGRRHGPIGLTV